MICDVPDVERVFFGAPRHFFLVHSQCSSTSANKTLELFDPKGYNKPNDAVLIDIEDVTRQGYCNWQFACGEALEV